MPYIGTVRAEMLANHRSAQNDDRLAPYVHDPKERAAVWAELRALHGVDTDPSIGAW